MADRAQGGRHGVHLRRHSGPALLAYELCKVAGTVSLDGVAAPTAAAGFRAEWQSS